jgi:hypothetical protein
MNRREFLQSLAAIGTALAIPASSLAQAPEPVIDHTWNALLNDPKVFYVNDWGMLSTRWGIEGVDVFVSRGELMHYPVPPSDGEELKDYIHDTGDLERHIDNHFSDLDPEQFDDWGDYVRRGDANAVREVVIEWLNDDPDDTDYTNANIWGHTGRGDAMYWFFGRAAIAVQIGISFEHFFQPANPNYGALLSRSVEDANRIVAEMGLPICFEEGIC